MESIPLILVHFAFYDLKKGLTFCWIDAESFSATQWVFKPGTIFTLAKPLIPLNHSPLVHVLTPCTCSDPRCIFSNPKAIIQSAIPDNAPRNKITTN